MVIAGQPAAIFENRENRLLGVVSKRSDLPDLVGVLLDGAIARKPAAVGRIVDTHSIPNVWGQVGLTHDALSIDVAA